MQGKFTAFTWCSVGFFHLRICKFSRANTVRPCNCRKRPSVTFRRGVRIFLSLRHALHACHLPRQREASRVSPALRHRKAEKDEHKFTIKIDEAPTPRRRCSTFYMINSVMRGCILLRARGLISPRSRMRRTDYNNCFGWWIPQLRRYLYPPPIAL